MVVVGGETVGLLVGRQYLNSLTVLGFEMQYLVVRIELKLVGRSFCFGDVYSSAQNHQGHQCYKCFVYLIVNMLC